MNYADMPAGPEMDRLVAQKVMGWRPGITSDHDSLTPSDEYCRAIGWDLSPSRLHLNPATMEGVDFSWHPSTGVAHAWEVVGKIADTGLDITINTWKGESRCSIDRTGPDGNPCQIADAFGETAALAICRCVLMAIDK